MDKAIIAIGFPNYKSGVTDEEIKIQRTIVETNMGHSHPPHEFFTIEEFSKAFSYEPLIYDQAPMPIGTQSKEETKLVANFAVFKIGSMN